MKVKAKKSVRAFSHLREVRHESQAAIAAQLGISLSGWQQWEYGSRQCKGAALKAVLALCPDEESRVLFTTPAVVSIPKPVPLAPEPIEEGEDKEPDAIKRAKPDVRRNFRSTRKGLKALWEQKQKGDRAAAEALKILAEEFRRLAAVATSPESPRGRRGELDRHAFDSELLE